MNFQIKKHKDRFCSRAYRMWLCTRQCFFCTSRECDPHHLVSRKWAEGSDATCIPLCRSCHDKAHAAKLGVRNCTGSLQLLWFAFLREHGISFVLPIDQAEFERLLTEAGMREHAFTRRKNR